MQIAEVAKYYTLKICHLNAFSDILRFRTFTAFGHFAGGHFKFVLFVVSDLLTSVFPRSDFLRSDFLRSAVNSSLNFHY